MSFSFRGASADTVAFLTEELERAAGTLAEKATMADDLFTVALTVRSEGALRRFVTDASTPAEARTGLVGEVFGGKVGAGALRVLTAAVGRRWTTPRDLADALEHLSVVAAVTSTGKDAGRLADELFSFGQVVKDNPSLRDALSDPRRSTADKASAARPAARRQGAPGHGDPRRAGPRRQPPHAQRGARRLREGRGRRCTARAWRRCGWRDRSPTPSCSGSTTCWPAVRPPGPPQHRGGPRGHRRDPGRDR